ncbi:Na+/H+ antiporter [Cladophialophora carrionii]|uniref:Na+/H+ antiporter n=1 Tax=Cladophialophora carrionii TaxID=86049 RepID=A0A1C1CA77_9EURO|nr:Na+/H+ antiporter [Cladophialophora carrionii]
MSDAALAYHEPDIVTILKQSSFLLVLNILGFILDHVFYCGLVGQVLIGMAWGAPGAKILPQLFQETVTQLGYLGLIMIVFEGGLAASARSLGRSVLLSISVALTGIAVPMALSFSLMGISKATRLQSFAAGAALCSTSLGTTFSLLKTTGLTSSRLGTVLTSAAMLDDVVGLALVEVISSLGTGRASLTATTVIRPVFVSLAFAIVLPVGCRLILKPVILRCSTALSQAATRSRFDSLGFSLQLRFIFSTALLLALVTSASYAGASNLFAAYLAGAMSSWVDEVSVQACTSRSDDIAHTEAEGKEGHTTITTGIGEGAITPAQAASHNPGLVDDTTQKDPTLPQQPFKSSCGLGPPPNDQAQSTTVPADLRGNLDRESRTMEMYKTYYASAVDRVLKPFFFASIGFSIPISKMFQGPVIWRGLVYAALMAIGKLCCGLWLVRFTTLSSGSPKTVPRAVASPSGPMDPKSKQKKPPLHRSLPQPRSLYPASILGCAMVARGEIGFLISALAATNGIFTSHDSTTHGEDSSDLTSGVIPDRHVGDSSVHDCWAFIARFPGKESQEAPT